MSIVKKVMRRWGGAVMSTLAPKPMVVSFPKCGRTWVANVLMNYIHYYADPSRLPLDFALKPQFKDVVKGTTFEPVVFSHDVFSLKIPIQDWPKASAVRYQNKEKALLIRDPRDVLVSLYYHALGRRHKNDLPEDISIRDFLETYAYGLEALIMFLNIWAPAAVSCHGIVRAYRYEDFLGEWNKNADHWMEFVRFITGRQVNESALERAVNDNEIASLKSRLLRNNAEVASLTGVGGRIRKGQAGGYTAELEEEDVAMIRRRLLAGLNSEARELIWPYMEH